MTRVIQAILVILFLVACSAINIPLVITTPVVSPSPLPAILSPTPPLIPSAMSTSTATILLVSPTLTDTSFITPTEISTATLTSTPTATLTPTPTTSPFQPEKLGVDILGCNTSLDILHQMGEVTNAYPILRNSTGKNLINVCATLSASDEARVHPDKTGCVALLPTGDQIVLKLTVDTGFRQDTAIQVVVTTTEGISASASGPSCQDIGLPGWLPDRVGMIEPIS